MAGIFSANKDYIGKVDAGIRERITTAPLIGGKPVGVEDPRVSIVQQPSPLPAIEGVLPSAVGGAYTKVSGGYPPPESVQPYKYTGAADIPIEQPFIDPASDILGGGITAASVGKVAGWAGRAAKKLGARTGIIPDVPIPQIPSPIAAAVVPEAFGPAARQVAEQVSTTIKKAGMKLEPIPLRIIESEPIQKNIGELKSMREGIFSEEIAQMLDPLRKSSFQSMLDMARKNDAINAKYPIWKSSIIDIIDKPGALPNKISSADEAIKRLESFAKKGLIPKEELDMNAPYIRMAFSNASGEQVKGGISKSDLVNSLKLDIFRPAEIILREKPLGIDKLVAEYRLIDDAASDIYKRLSDRGIDKRILSELQRKETVPPYFSGDDANLANDYINKFKDMRRISGQIEMMDSEAKIQYKANTIPSGFDRKEILLQKPGISENVTTHWGGRQNVFAHIRSQSNYVDMPGRTKKKLYVVDEIQSDWHQQTAKHDKIQRLIKEKEALEEKISSAAGNNDADIEALRRMQDEVNRLDGKIIDSAAGMSAEKPPTGPFSKNWHEVALRRAIRDAVEDGHDMLGIVTGQVQTARYPKHAKALEVFYDNTLKNSLAKIGKEYGVTVKRMKIADSDAGEEVYTITLPYKLRQDVLTKGQKLFSIPAATAIAAGAKTNELKQNK